MAPDTLLSTSAPPAFPARFDPRATAQSLSTVEQRLASAERELRIQFTRIAQLQAELDLLQAALRRSGDGPHMRLSVAPSCTPLP
jgi:hypothetical protein